MRSRDKWIQRWRFHVAGMALYGIVSETRDGTLARAAKVMDLPDRVDELLGKMYDDLLKEDEIANGKANFPIRKVEGKP